MAKRALPLLTGGLNEVTRSDLIEDSQLQQCDNYEITGDGVLRKRKSQTTYNYILNSTLSYIFDINNGGSILKISEPYYPQKKLVPNTDPSITMIGDYIIFVVGLLPAPNETNYIIHAFWQTSNYTWSNDVFWSELNTSKTFPGLLSDAGITYPTDSVTAEDIEFTIGNNKVMISDGYNRVHYFEVDADGIANAGFLGIPAPKNKPKIISPDSTVKRGNISNEDVDFEDDSGANYVEAPGLAQVTYTVITKFGEESNPSPISDALDLQWFKLNEDTGANEQWINSIRIYDLNIPDVAQSIEDIIDKFRIYLRVTPYSQGDTAKTLTFTEEFDISNKTIEAVDTGNDYRMTIYPTTGQTVSYENDIAPVAKTTSELGGIIMAGNVLFGHTFPFKFKYVHRIELNNKDSKFYVEPWFRIRLGDKDIEYNDAVNAKPIENFEILDFINNGNTDSSTDNHLKRSGFIRIYFEDQTTPCMLGYVNRINQTTGDAVSLDNNTTPSYIDLLIKIPYLRANDSTSIYLVWTPDNNEDEALYPGVPDDYNDITDTEIGFDYGRLISLGYDDYDKHRLFPDTRVLDDQTVLAFDFSKKNSSGELFNKADDNGVIIQQGDIPETENISQLTSISSGSAALLVVGYENYTILDQFNQAETSSGLTYTLPEGIYQKYLYLDNTFGGVVLDNQFFKNSTLDGKSGFVSFWYYLKNPSKSSVYANYSQYNVCTIWGDDHINTDYSSSKKVLRLYVAPSGSHQNLHIDDNRGFYSDGATNDNTNHTDTGIKMYNDASVGSSWDDKQVSDSMFIMMSWNSEMSKVSVWVRLKDGSVYSKSMDIPSSGWNKITNSESSFNGLVLGSHSGSDTADQMKSTGYADVTLQLGEYLDADTDSSTYEDEYARFINYTNRGGLFEEIIGYRESPNNPGTHNNSMSFTETQEIAGKQQKNMVKWTDVNHTSFPDLNYKVVTEPVKKIIPAPSFLQYQYQNTFLIFTRNTINRFILEGSASGWAANAGSLIEEKKQYGLLADKSLMRIGDAVFWLSEVGIVKWDSQGLNLISKNVVNIAIEDDSFAFYNSINNQYMLHQSDGTTYVYHIDRNMWTKYTGLSIESTGILTGGSELDNINLLLNGANQIDKFPSGEYTDDSATIKTKNLFFESGLLKRVRLDYEGGTPDLTTNLTKIDSDGLEIEKSNTITGIQKNKWRGIANGYNRGRSVNIEITDAEEIKSIMYDLNIESEVTT